MTFRSTQILKIHILYFVKRVQVFFNISKNSRKIIRIFLTNITKSFRKYGCDICFVVYL